MSKYTREQALDIVQKVIDLPHGEDTYDVVDMNESIAVVHHHNNAEAQYSHLRGVVIDLDDEVMLTKSALGSIPAMNLRDFKLTEGNLHKVFCGVEGTNLKILKHKGTVYYVTNRRIYTAADRKDSIYVDYTMDILNKNHFILFHDHHESAPYYHEFILVNRSTSHLTTIQIPEKGFLVYVGTRIMNDADYDESKDAPIIPATELTKVGHSVVPVTTKHIYCTKRNTYSPVSTIYPTEPLPNNIDKLTSYINQTKEFCIVSYTDNEGFVHTVRVCHYDYLHREGLLQFSNNLLKRYISLCRSTPMDKSKNRHQAINKYVKRHRIYVFEDTESVLEMMKKNKRISYINRDKYRYCKTNMDTDKYLINTWIDMYSALPNRSKNQVYNLYSKYIAIVDTLEDLMTQVICGDTPDCPPSVLKYLKEKVKNIKHFSAKEDAFECTDKYHDHLFGYVRRSIIQYTKVDQFYDMATALDLV